MHDQASRILTYHALYEAVPPEFAGKIHNVDPDSFFRQMRWCQANFDMVGLEAMRSDPSRDSRGRLAITFDDGNETVFSTALPILEELGIPSTVFLTGTALRGSHGWRDKMRYLLAHQWRGEFISFAGPRFFADGLRDDSALFQITKNRAYPSNAIESLLDAFLAYKGARHFGPVRHRLPAGGLPRGPLVRYGNHSENHYVLTSLSRDEQKREIADCHLRLLSAGLDLVPWFAVPFGRPSDLDTTGFRVLESLGYLGCLWNSGCTPPARSTGGGLVFLGREKAPPTLDALQKSFALEEVSWLVPNAKERTPTVGANALSENAGISA